MQPTTHPNAAIDWLTAGEAPALQAFIDEHWQRGHVLARDLPLLRWQYKHPEDDELISVLGAKIDDRLVAFLGLIQVPFAIAGSPVPGAWLAMWKALPEASERHLGLALLLHALRLRLGGIACLGMNEGAVRIYSGLGFDVVSRLPRWVRPLAPEALDALVPGSGRWPAPRHAAVRPDPGAFDGERAERWDSTWTLTFAPRLAGTWRDAAFLRARYVEHPRFTYEVRLTGDGSAVLVYRIEQVRDREERVLRVLECLGPAEPLVAAMLEEHADVAFADFYCTDPGPARALEQLGFAREETLPALLPERFQPLEPPGRGLNGVFRIPLEGRVLYCTKSDGDQDRPS